MKIVVIPAAPAEAAADGLVRRAQECPRPAGKVGDAEAGDRLRVGPVDVQPPHAERREERRRRGKGVEGGQELPVRDQSLKHLPRNVLHGKGADALQLARHPLHPVHHRDGHRWGEQLEEAERDVEDRPVVDVAENRGPAGDHLAMQRQPQADGRPIGRESGHAADVGDRPVECDRVAQDSHGHAGGLRAGLLTEFGGDAIERVKAHVAALALVDRVLGGLADRTLQDLGALGDDPLRHPGVLDHRRQLIDVALQPAALGPPGRRAGRATVEGVPEGAGRDAGAEILLAVLTQLFVQQHGHHMLDLPPVTPLPPPEASQRVVLDPRARRKLSLDDDRRHVPVVHQDVGPACPVLEHLRRLGDHLPARVLAVEHLPEEGVDRGFAVHGASARSWPRVPRGPRSSGQSTSRCGRGCRRTRRRSSTGVASSDMDAPQPLAQVGHERPKR